jgi:hypothetical protein
MTITGEQCKAARGLLGWALIDLGYRARVSEPTVAAFERTLRVVAPDKVLAIKRVLEAAGIEFDDKGYGVRLRDTRP